MKIAVRQATPDDLPAVLGLYAQPDMDSGQTLSIDKAQKLLAEFASYPNYRLFVACDEDEGGAVVGSYALLIMHNLAHCGAASAIAEDVVVVPNRQGQGIGRRMMIHAIEQARLAGCYKLALSSDRKRHAAHAFYESLGFARHGLSFLIEP
ncbi:MAG: GNAT family N-acetyltransferase [Gammaproteobacteria bacterium]|nr:GNAT family N-acetyltransferase [Rhodocyclaceae bacterium]MBU3908820.1 GNAT family N-acetyltransferase [Gammaproteobacteria bacterium]MBU3988429.1 GNAT family N-acetyltransferase [Gammaproteobacteria bacterium]MBU4003655.1 GNAT family N-acetyltransferase [Gammaproteobacteria bacterium]MBU4021769.1 GNAT family N-acetyltransferase [Gammaproteobacteria bacterium]